MSINQVNSYLLSIFADNDVERWWHSKFVLSRHDEYPAFSVGENFSPDTAGHMALIYSFKTSNKENIKLIIHIYNDCIHSTQ
jgi:hypothetical protein